MINHRNCCHLCITSNDVIIWIRLQYGKTPLHYVHEWGNIEAVEFLVEHGAQIDMQDKASDKS